jgi:hypothetical protein
MQNDPSFFLSFVNNLVNVARFVHFPLMLGAFAAAIGLRLVVFYTVKRHEWFAVEFEKRVGRFLKREDARKTQNSSFYVISKKLMEATFFEVFENREKLKRRRSDNVMTFSDRVFLVKQGCAWIVHDLLKQIRFLRYGDQPPKLQNITRNVFSKNPFFNSILGLIPTEKTNEVLNILPGLFVIGGIFGTFLGVMKGIPELSGMDLNDPEKTKMIMDQFLAEVAMSMGSSLMGIFFSVCTTLLNTWYSPDRTFAETMERFENSLDLLWNYAHSNEVPVDNKPFDEHRDPLEALAEASLNQELSKRKSMRDMEDDPTPTTKVA